MPAMPSRRREQVALDPTRVVAYSDGVFVVAATLLIVALDIPDVSPSELTKGLEETFGQLYAYFLSFWVIGLFWIRHHRLFGRIERWDTRFVALNLGFLAFIAVLPLPAELLGKYPDEPISPTVYAVNMVILSLLLTFLHLMAERWGLVRKEAQGLHRAERLRGVVVTAVMLVSIVVAWTVDATASMYLWLLIIPAFRLTARLADRKRDDGPRAGGRPSGPEAG